MINHNTIENRLIVPYSPNFLLKCNAHINVVICTTVKSIKYIVKYNYRGYDCFTITLKNETEWDEISSYIGSKYINAWEALETSSIQDV